jgi:hypothetical protein
MTALSAATLKDLIRRTQERWREIDHADWDGNRYRTPSDTAKWQQAARENAPPEWREIVRVLAQGESYYGGRY